MKKFLFLILAILSFTSINSFAYNTDTNSVNASNWNFAQDFAFFQTSKSYFIHKSPTIEVQYGLAKQNFMHDNFDAKFGNLGDLEFRLGSTSIFKYKYDTVSNVVEFENQYLYIGNLKSELTSKQPDNYDINARVWRFGVDTKSGYGYKFGEDAYLLLYANSGYGWFFPDYEVSKNPSSNPAVVQKSKEAIKVFGNNLRFGETFETGMTMYMTKNLGLSAAYSSSHIFPRYMFWKQSGSMIIEAAGSGIIDIFVSEVGKSMPEITPVLNILLKSAYNYGMYELKKEKMAWPFNTAAPLQINSFKVGLSFKVF